jgi:hypothetical protein
LQLHRVFEHQHAVAGGGDLGQQALASVVLPVLVPPAIRMFWRSRTARTSRPACAAVIIPSSM